ncbi:MAG: hypothetical protein EP338_01960 [Bacteroidetes bacterium]|nr:MAG: hypothetical protein EP338_01960 [Bacteroidota bacterium]
MLRSHRLILLLMLIPFSFYSQIGKGDSLHLKSKLGGTVAYYFWQEDSLGKIIPGSFERPFRRNEIVVLNSKPLDKEKFTQQRLIRAVSHMSHNNKRESKRFFKVTTDSSKSRLHLPLRKRASIEMSTVQYRKRAASWESFTRKNVLYFNIFQDSSKSYSHSNDSIVLSSLGVCRKAEGHYFVKTFWNRKQEIITQQVFAYNGTNVTSYFCQEEQKQAQRILIFSNGYRGPKKDRDLSDDLITKSDRYHYWMKLDKLFLKRMQPDDWFYIDGSHDIHTSNHRNKANFGKSYSRVKALRKTAKNAQFFDLLNTEPNVEGFYFRKEKGYRAAQAFQALRCDSPSCLEVKDTIDLVCHSMGYAYALGFLEALRGEVIYGKVYIIAPENACTDGLDWDEFEEVWQYGSNLDQEDPDPVWEQDGIAPQCEVKNLSSALKGGRVFLPRYVRKKDFVNSHLLRQYHWIIKKIPPGGWGYIGR